PVSVQSTPDGQNRLHHGGSTRPDGPMATIGRPALRPVFARAGYRRLFAAQTISRWGDTVSTVALVVLVYRLTGSGLGVGGAPRRRSWRSRLTAAYGCCLESPTRCVPTARPVSASCARWGCSQCWPPGTRSRRPPPPRMPPGSASCTPNCSRKTNPRWWSGCAPPAAQSLWSATASTTRPPSPPPTSASRSPPAPARRWPPPASPGSRAASAPWRTRSCSPRATLRIIRQNLGWAFGYNLLLVPLAAAGILPPVLAALAMAASSVTVIGNALRLRRFRTTDGSATTRPPTPTTAAVPTAIGANR